MREIAYFENRKDEKMVGTTHVDSNLKKKVTYELKEITSTNIGTFLIPANSVVVIHIDCAQNETVTATLSPSVSLDVYGTSLSTSSTSHYIVYVNNSSTDVNVTFIGTSNAYHSIKRTVII